MLYPALAERDLVYILQLIRTPGIGPITFFSLLARYHAAEEALKALPELSRRGGRQTPLKACERDKVEREMERTEHSGARMVLYGAPSYPPLLTDIADAPPLLTVIGHNHLLQQRQAVALVGSRNASAGGCQLAQRLAKDCGEAGYTVISGLARGIDTFAHKGALATGTIGVIAGGIDTVYPPENQMLYQQLRETGVIISEQPFGQAPFASAFPSRNRIIAGMSQGTVVVEAAPKSGSLITARLAGEYDREVFAVPGSPLDPRSKGANQLLKQGAQMVEAASDITQGLAHWRHGSLQETRPHPYLEAAESDAASDAELASARSEITSKLSYTAITIDELMAQTGVSASVMLTVLLELELAGRARRSPGNKIALVASDREEAIA